MLPLARDGFSAEQVQATLHSGVVDMQFRYELLDEDENFKKNLTTITDAEVSVKSLATIKRTARFTMMEDDDVDFLRDRIAPYVRVRIPPTKVLANIYSFLNPYQTTVEGKVRENEGGWVEFPMGIFLLSAPTRTDDTVVMRDVQGYDGLLILQDDKFIDRYSIPAGTTYYDAIKAILNDAGITKINLEYTDKVLNDDKEFEPGTEKLTAINSLLAAINYDGLKVDVYGYYTSSLYQTPNQRAVEYTYRDDDLSVTMQGVEEEFPIGDVPNQFVAVRSNAEDEPLYSTYINNNPDSPVSTVNRGRVITRREEVQDIADQEALDGYVQRIAHEATKLYGKVKFKTGLMPMHDTDDCIQFEYSALGITEKYTETSWTMKLEAGAEMEHEIRRIVQI